MAYSRVTLTTLQARLAERYEAVPFWTADEATRAINEALRVWNAITGFWKAQVTATGIKYDPFVALAGSMVWQCRVAYGTTPLVGPVSLRELNLMYPQWRSERTDSGGDVPTAPEIWCKVSMTQFVVWPALGETEADAFTIDGVRSTPVLAAGGDFIDIGDEEHNVLLGYALHALSLKLGGKILHDTRAQYMAFLAAGAQRNDMLAASNWYRQTMGLDHQRSLRPPQVKRPIRTPALEGG